jgi:hypothetical protein
MKVLEEEWFRLLELACSFGLILFGLLNLSSYYYHYSPPSYRQTVLFFFFAGIELAFITVRFMQILGIRYQRTSPDSALDEYVFFFIFMCTIMVYDCVL